MKATTSPGEAQSGLSGIASKVAIGGGGSARPGRRCGCPSHVLKALSGGEGWGQEGGAPSLCTLLAVLDMQPPTYILSAYAHDIPVIMVMCPFAIGSRPPLLLCSSPILDFLFWDNLKS